MRKPLMIREDDECRIVGLMTNPGTDDEIRGLREIRKSGD
jgi:hypothetical protein